MTVVNALKSGIAPGSTKVGDVVHTAGGNYQVVHAGTPGSYYNPASGFSSIKLGNNFQDDLIAYNQATADRNTAKSQEFAREQMAYQTESNAKAMKFSAEQARIQRQWEERMSNTAHQREVADLISAGLNPVLSATYGGSATPNVSSATGVASSGATGQVDSSVNQLVGGLLNALISQSTALQTTAMSNETALKTASIAGMYGLQSAQTNAGAMLQSALTSAAASRYASDVSYANTINRGEYDFMNNVYSRRFEEYLRKNYPTDYFNALNKTIRTTLDALSNPNSKQLSKLNLQMFGNELYAKGLDALIRLGSLF